MHNNTLEKHILSKSTFIRGMQCTKSLYLNKHHPELKDKISPELQEIFRRGTNVGLLARDLFPGGIDASPKEPGNYRQSVLYTQELLSDNAPVIYEAAFQHEGVLCLIDILVNENGKWKAYEVKSSKRITKTYIMDASLQYHVITGTGLILDDIFIVYMNNKYVRKGELDLHSLFTARSVYKKVNKNQELTLFNINRLKSILISNEIPDVDIGGHCSKPYDCDFKGYCWKHIPENSVFDLANMGYKAYEMYDKDIVKIEDIPDDYPLSYSQKLQVKCFKNNKIHINKGKISSFLKTISYPLYFLDFESFMPAVPFFDNTQPYQHIPFQYSLHHREQKNGDLFHYEYLAVPGVDPRREFIEQLLANTQKPGDFLVYNKTFEITRLREIAQDFPEYAEDIEALILRIVDLMIPFQKKFYYSPNMNGRYSIKFVLPALVPGLSYDNMVIGNGRTAMEAFEALQHNDDKQSIKEIRHALLEYCKLDTLALVKILEKLEEIIE